jgi:hypothetical protein
MQVYTRTQTVIANVPYSIMLLTGAAVIALGFGLSPGALLAAAGYAVYGIAGALWIMVFICRYCGYYGTRGCPCGYGVIAARIVPKGEHECFAEKFKRHIPVIVPLWLIPAACGAVQLSREFSTALAWLLGVFVFNSFVLLPWVSRRHGCSECPQKDDCPWMAKDRVAS